MIRRRFLASAFAAAAVPARAKPARKEKPDPYADAVLVKGPPPPPADGAFTLAVLPDTQYYASRYPDTFMMQTRWIAENAATRRIAGVLHLGDVTNNNEAREWKNAAAALSLLDASLPFCMVPGNHDYGPGGDASNRDTGFSKAFPPDFFRRRPSCGGFWPGEPERTDNSFHRFEAAGRRILVIGLEFGPRPEVVRWAADVVARHPDHEAILVTHAFVYHDDTRYDWRRHGRKQNNNPHNYPMAAGSPVTDGEELWQQLIAPSGRFVLTLNGHVTGDGLGRLASPDAARRPVHQMLVNFQMRPRGGDGWLRLLEFRPDRSLHVIDWSPLRNECNHSPQNRFSVALADAPA